jgi:hypothetical protein
MIRSLFTFLCFAMFGVLSAEELPKDLPELKKLLDNRIWECEDHKKLLTDSHDVYTWYILYGRQAAYQEILLLIDRIQKEQSDLLSRP